MGRMTVHGDGNRAASLKAWLAQRIEQAAWEVSRGSRVFTRLFGVFGWSMLILFAVGATVWLVEHQQVAEMNTLYSQLARQGSLKEPAHPQIVQHVDAANGADGRARLKAFEDYLLPHKDIPVVVRDLLRLANEAGLSIPRGEYRPQPDLIGGFVRYRMSLPVKGAAPAIHRFIQASLRKQKTLALESVMFKRERSATSEIEARIQWVVLTRLADRGAGSMVTLSTDGGDAP